MSTIITNGYTFEGSFFELNEKLNKVSEKLVEKAKVFTQAAIATMLTEIIDQAKLGNLKPAIAMGASPRDGWETEDFYLNTYSGIMKELRKEEESEFRLDDNDFSASVSISPVGDKLAVLLYCNDESLRKYAESLLEENGIKEYFYWNNVDEPEDMTEEEWNQRKEFWDKCFADIAVPKYCCYNRILTDLLLVELKGNEDDGNAVFSLSNILKQMQPVEVRAEAIAKDWLLDAVCEENGISIKAYSEYTAAMKICQTPENQARKDEKAKELRDVL